MKKIISIILILVIIVSFIPLTASATQDISVEIDGVRVEFTGQRPVVVGKRQITYTYD